MRLLTGYILSLILLYAEALKEASPTSAECVSANGYLELQCHTPEMTEAIKPEALS